MDRKAQDILALFSVECRNKRRFTPKDAGAILRVEL